MKAIKVLVNILFYGIIALALAIVLGFALGYKAKTVLTNSMEPNIKVASVVVIKPESFDNLKVNDVINFYRGGNDITFTHRIYEIDYEAGTIITKGDNNTNIDPFVTSKEQVVGKVLFSIPYVGYLINFIKSYIIYIVLITLSILMFSKGIKMAKELKKEAKK